MCGLKDANTVDYCKYAIILISDLYLANADTLKMNGETKEEEGGGDVQDRLY